MPRRSLIKNVIYGCITTIDAGGQMRLRIAFQGGGARLALYLPVIKALQKFQKSGTITITELSGASAGAIAAVLLAADANVDAFREYCRGLKLDEIRKVFPAVRFDSLLDRSWAFQRVLRGKPFGDEDEFVKLLKTGLNRASVNYPTVGMLPITTKIAIADLTSAKPKYADSDAPLVNSLVQSAALPFIFRMSGDVVDGGLLENLPVRALLHPGSPALDQSHVIAIGFGKPDYLSPVQSPLQMGLRLLDAAMVEKTEYAKSILGSDHVLELQTDFGKVKAEAFSPESFLALAQDDNINKLIEHTAEDWLNRFIAQKSGGAPAPPGSIASEDVSEERDSSEIALTQSSGLRRIAAAYHQQSKIKYTKTILQVIANSAKNSSEQDTFTYIDQFVVLDVPMFAYVTKIFMSNQGTVTSDHLRVFDDTDSEVPIVTFSVPDADSKHTWTLVVFEKPLIPSEPPRVYTLKSKQLGSGSMKPLVEHGCDYLSIQVNQAESADLAEIRLIVPEAMNLSMRDGTRERLNDLKIECVDSEDDDIHLVKGSAGTPGAEHYEMQPLGFKTYIWRAEKLDKHNLLRVLFTKV